MAKQASVSLFTEEFDELCRRRDLAGYAVVGCLEVEIHACDRGQSAYAQTILERAKEKCERPESELSNLKNQKGAVTHGHSVERSHAA